MYCPQCGIELAGEARACGSCGWTASRKTLWITIGCILGGLFLICCGIGTYGFFKMKRIAESVVTPLQVLYCRMQVVNYAKNHGGALPDTLEKACEEPLKGKSGEEIRIQFDDRRGKPGEVADMYGTALRYVKNADGTFEVRSAGRDRTFDNEDDVVERGKAGEDLDELQKRLETTSEVEVQKALKGLGIDVKTKHGGAGESPPPSPPPPPGPAPAPAPTPPPPPAEGPK